MSKELLDLFEALDDNEEEVREGNILKAPFSYPGGKQKGAQYILPLLPYRNAYVEPFGGGANILLARKPSPIEVYNDRFGGVVDFYHCIRDQDLLNRLCERLEYTIHSREEFNWCKTTWVGDNDIVERAAKWFYITVYSFGSQGRAFGRATVSPCRLAGKIHDALEGFTEIHERLRNVQIENQDFSQIMKDFDDFNAVFYCDPPYINTSSGVYKNEMTEADHRRLLDLIHSMKGFVAISSYPNEVYDSYDWDDYFTWDHFETTTGIAFRETNNKINSGNERGKVKEALYIKEAL